jgi:hypothetical protein
MRLRRILPVLAVLAFALTACTSPAAPAVEDTVTTVTTETGSAPAPDEDMTQLVVDLSWQQQTEDDRDAMCLGLAVYGTDWGADQMRLGAGDESVDWDRAAELVAQKCAER